MFIQKSFFSSDFASSSEDDDEEEEVSCLSIEFDLAWTSRQRVLLESDAL